MIAGTLSNLQIRLPIIHPDLGVIAEREEKGGGEDK
jgi:hypothetical protein